MTVREYRRALLIVYLSELRYVPSPEQAHAEKEYITTFLKRP